MVQVEASLALPQQIDQKVPLCNDHKSLSVCINVTVCFNVTSRHFKGFIGSAPSAFRGNRLGFVHRRSFPQSCSFLSCRSSLQFDRRPPPQTILYSPLLLPRQRLLGQHQGARKSEGRPARLHHARCISEGEVRSHLSRARRAPPL